MPMNCNTELRLDKQPAPKVTLLSIRLTSTSEHMTLHSDTFFAFIAEIASAEAYVPLQSRSKCFETTFFTFDPSLQISLLRILLEHDLCAFLLLE